MVQVVQDVVTWLKNWFYEKNEVYNKSESYSKSEVNNALNNKLNSNLTTANKNLVTNSIGDIILEDKIIVDSALSSSSTNPVQNQIINTALNDKVNTVDVVNNLTTTTPGKVLDARQGRLLADLIGDAITYINL